MNIILFDNNDVRQNLLPISFTRPLADFRIGISTIREKWEFFFGDRKGNSVSYLTADYLTPKFPASVAPDNLFIAGNYCPEYSDELRSLLLNLQVGEALMAGDELVAFRGSLVGFRQGEVCRRIEFPAERLVSIHQLYDIFRLNGRQLLADFAVVDKSDAAKVSETNRVIGPLTDAEGRPLIYISPEATVEGAMLNTTHGPIYVGPEAEVMEGSCLRGPIAICRHAVVNMGTKIYPETTIGPWCKVGGELNNVVMHGYSNKAHDGFLGNAVIGEWCNLGAGCVASNLKNDYTPIKLWNYAAHRFLRTGLQFCGLIMGDHSKAGINTMFNTATVVGVGVNVHGSGFPRNFIASFSEGGASGFADVPLTKFFDIAARVMARRDKQLTDTDRKIFEEIYRIAETYK